MTIPRLAPLNEPDLGLDGGPRAGADETVAGSLIEGSMGTVANQSVSGKSMSGRSSAGRSAAGHAAGHSVAGHSVAGRSAAGRPSVAPPEYVAPPVDNAPSELEALKHVGQSEADPFDVRGGTDQVLREGRSPARPNRSPPELVSALSVLVLAGSLAYAAFAKTQAATVNLSPAVAAEAGKPMTAVTVQAVLVFVLTAAVAAPLVLAGWVGACKALNFRTPRGLYMRSFGLAALPAAAFVLAYALGLAPSAAALALATAGLGYVILQFVHGQQPILAGAATGLGTLGGAVGVAAAVMVADGLSQGMFNEYQKGTLAKASAVVKHRTEVANAKTANAGSAVSTSNTAEADAAVKTLRSRVDALKARLASSQQTREAVDAEATAVATALADARKAYADRPEWDAMTADLQTAQSAIAQLPTSKPPADLNEAPPSGTEWGVRAGPREASAFAYNFTPPANALLDLGSAMASEGAPVIWSVPASQATIRLELIKSVSNQQQRPWVAPAFVIAATKDTPVAVAVEGKSAVEYGTINGVPAAKISAGEGSTGRVLTVYTLHQGDTWLKATIGPAAPNDSGLDAAEAAVRSLRLRSPGEAPVDPLPAADLVARFNADPTSVDKVAALLRGKPGAEDAVLKGIGFAPDDATLKKFGPLLAAAATGDKGARFLWKLADDDDETAEASRETLRRIQPKAADDIAFALLDVKSNTRGRVQSGLTALEAAEVDKARQPTVTRTLVSVFEQLSSGTYGRLLEGVLGKWLDDDLGRRVQTVLETPTSGEAERRMAMRVLATTGKQKYVASIGKWLVLDSSSADTLVQMGPMVEGDVIKMLADRDNTNPKFRLVAIGVLQEVGTARSITTLQRLTGGLATEDVREAAKQAILQIRERDQAAKAAQPK